MYTLIDDNMVNVEGYIKFFLYNIKYVFYNSLNFLCYKRGDKESGTNVKSKVLKLFEKEDCNLLIFPSGYVSNNRVIAQLNHNSTFVEEYWVDSIARPMSGIGSIITIQLGGEGILANGARVLRAAVDLEKASAVAASTPVASGVLKNNGADLPAAEVAGLLAAWKRARSDRSTAYLTSTLEFQPVSFSPKDMMYNEASQYLATQIARLMNVPAYYISADMNNSMTYQNILDGRKEFVAYSLQPFISAIENRLSMDDITAHGNVVRFALDETFLRADTAARLDAIEKMLNLGLIDLQQAQSMEQLSPMGLNEGNGTNDINL
jgi:hypothetical protein